MSGFNKFCCRVVSLSASRGGGGGWYSTGPIRSESVAISIKSCYSVWMRYCDASTVNKLAVLIMQLLLCHKQKDSRYRGIISVVLEQKKVT